MKQDESATQSIVMKSEIFDTHCHIQFDDYGLDPADVIESARLAGVTRMMSVGCSLHDSQQAIEMASKYDNVWASIGLHPHEASRYVDDESAIQSFRGIANSPKVVAIGETGLDYFYNHSSKEDQKKMLRLQLDIASQHDLALIFHIREAFDDFWEIFDTYKGIRGVVHSFTAGPKELAQVLERGLYVGLNGIITFTKNIEQLEAIKSMPLQSILLETDAPFLTPVPLRGTICSPEHARLTADFLAKLRDESIELVASVTTQNALNLFRIK